MRKKLPSSPESLVPCLRSRTRGRAGLLMRALPFLLMSAPCLLLMSTAAVAQVSVAPTAIFLSERSRFATMQVANQSTQPQEVNVEFRFGYPMADSSGQLFVQYEDSVAESRHSVEPYVRAFPQRFVLPPGETQVVRLTARIPPDLPDGMYWTRVLTTSSPQIPFPDSVSEEVRARVVFRLQQVTALFYKKNNPSVTVSLNDVQAEADSQTVAVEAHIGRDGNAPFLGSAVIRILDERGRTVHEEQQTVAVYFDDRRRFTITLPALPRPGTYVAEITLTSKRQDLPDDELLPAPSVRRRVTFVVP